MHLHACNPTPASCPGVRQQQPTLRTGDRPDAVADVALHASPQGQVLFIRLYDAEGSDLAVGQQKDAASRVQALSKVH